jgi:hypothetical protein
MITREIPDKRNTMMMRSSILSGIILIVTMVLVRGIEANALGGRPLPSSASPVIRLNDGGGYEIKFDGSIKALRGWHQSMPGRASFPKVVIVGRGYGQEKVYFLAADGKVWKSVAIRCPGPSDVDILPEFIVFAREGETRRATFCDFDGNELMRIDTRPQGSYDGAPDIGPGGFSTKLGYMAGTAGYEGGSQEGEPRPLLFFKGGNILKRYMLFPGGGSGWSPDGERFVWTEKAEVHLFSFAGERLWTRSIPPLPAGSRGGGFSTTGKFVFCTDDRHASYGLPQIAEGWVFDLSGKLVTRIQEGTPPSFTPDDRFAVQFVFALGRSETNFRVIDMSTMRTREYSLSSVASQIPGRPPFILARVSGFLKGRDVAVLEAWRWSPMREQYDLEGYARAPKHAVALDLAKGKLKVLQHLPQRYLGDGWTTEIEESVLRRGRLEVVPR